MLTHEQARAKINRIAAGRKAHRVRKAMSAARAQSAERLAPVRYPVAPLELTVLGPPKPWQRVQRGRGGSFVPKETRDYQEAVQRAAWAALAQARALDTWPVDASYLVAITAHFPDARRRDVDNVAKSVLDGLNTVLWNDDSQVATLTVNREIDREQPRAVVRVEVVCDD